MKLRFNLDELVPDIARRLAQKNGLIEVKPMIWASADYQAFYAQKRAVTKGHVATKISFIQGVRYIKNDKGHTVFFDEERFTPVELHWGQADLPHLYKGFTHRLVIKKTMRLQLHVSHKGIVRFRSDNKGIQCLSFRNMRAITHHLQTDDIIRLLTLPANQEWLEDLLKGPREGRLLLANNLVRSCSSFQQFVNRINPTLHKVSAKKLQGISIPELIEVMKVASRLHNPHELLEDVSAYFVEKKEHSLTFQMLEDYLNMQDRQDKKAWYSLNLERIRKHHDKAVLAELDTAPVEAISISPAGYLFKTYFPNDQYELIEDGVRLKKEGILQRHCVGSYAYKINSHQCFIISIEYEHKRYTAELKVGMWEHESIQLNLTQLWGFANTVAPQLLHTEVMGLVERFNDSRYSWDIIKEGLSQKKALLATEYS